MAKVSFNFALESLLKVIVRETNLLLKAGFEMQLLIGQLQMIQQYIQPSGSRHDSDLIAISLIEIKQLRDAAYEAEDLIDKYTVKVTKYKNRGKTGKFFHGLGHAKMVRDSPNKIKRIKKKIDEIIKNKKIFESVGDKSKGEDEGARPNEEVPVKKFVNFTSDIEKVEHMLNDTQGGRRVISILGMGGCGKTALVRKLCQQIRETKIFDCVVLVTVEQTTFVDDILRKIISSLAEQHGGINELGLIKAQVQKKKKEDTLSRTLEEFDYEKLKQILLLHLQDKRYLLVIDNLWETQWWGRLLEAFPDDSNGSRIIITSRRKGVANCTNSLIHFIPGLGEEHRSQLFCNVVFDHDSCPQDLEDPKKEIVDFSHGLPIVIVEVGSILAKEEKNKDAWNRFIDNGNLYPNAGRKLWRDKLASSYDQIKITLKFCFFYFGLFPDNYDIPVRQLIQLWIAEEFIPQDSRITLEEVAEEYLQELIERLLIEPTSWRLDGGVKTCRIHNILRDLCLYESNKEDFLEVIHHHSNFPFHSKPRRLSLHPSTHDFIEYSSSKMSPSVGCNTSSIRSFLCFGTDTNPIQRKHLKWLCESIRMLRVLKFGDEPVHSIPQRICKLYLLKYLKLHGAELKDLPDSICELINLVTLDLRGSLVNHLPPKIWKLQNLRHLYISQPTKLLAPSNDSKIFPCLQIFSWLVLDQDTCSLIANGQLPLVKNFGLSTELLEDQIPENVFEMIRQSISHLERLKIRATLSELSSKPSFIIWSLFKSNMLDSLVKLTLVECYVDFALFKNHPRLQYLKVHGGISSENCLKFQRDSFRDLQAFQMTKFPIDKWEISEGAIPHLKRLIIKECRNLKVETTRLQHLTMLKKVHVHRPCTEELAGNVRQLKIDMGNQCDVELFD